MRNKKGVVPLIATLLLIVIVSATALVVFSYVSGATVLPDTDQQTGKMLEKLKTVQVRGYIDETIRIYIMNVGSVDSTIDSFYVKDFNGNILGTYSVNIPIAVGETKIINFSAAGQKPWLWYEITGVTERGNKVKTALYGYYTGSYSLGPPPGAGNSEYIYGVSGIMTNGIWQPASTYILVGGEDQNTYNTTTMPQYISYNYSVPPSYYDYNSGTAKYEGPKDTTGALDVVGDNKWIHINNNGAATLSGEFIGQVGNAVYPTLNITFVFFENTDRWGAMVGTLEFWDWAAGQYRTSGNGFWQFTKNDGTNLGGGYYLFTKIVTNDNLLSTDGDWNVRINFTSDKDLNNNKFDYLALTEGRSYTTGVESVFYFGVNDVQNKYNITNLIFSVTGLFPPSGIDYWVDLFNYNTNKWENIAFINGSTIIQPWIFDVNTECYKYVSASKQVAMRIFPMDDLPPNTSVQYDLVRLIVWTNN